VIEVREMQRSPPIHRFKIVLPLCDTGANPGSKWSFGLFADAAGTSSEYLAAEDPELDVIFLEGPSGESYTEEFIPARPPKSRCFNKPWFEVVARTHYRY